MCSTPLSLDSEYTSLICSVLVGVFVGVGVGVCVCVWGGVGVCVCVCFVRLFFLIK